MEFETKMKNINIEEFRKLEQVVHGTTRVKIVDWSIVLQELINKPFDFSLFKQVVSLKFPLKTKLNYSEMYRVIQVWTKKKEELIVDSRVTKEKNVVYLVTRVKKQEMKEKK